MQRIIYITKFFCELCNADIPAHLYGDADSSFTPEDEPELIDWSRHFHWTDNHRVCAVCGKYVGGEDLELLVNDGKVRIHEAYTDEYRKIERGEKFGPLLIVHESCIKAK